MFAGELSAAVDSGMGSITNILCSKHCKLEAQVINYMYFKQYKNIVNKKNVINIIVEDNDSHVVETESWANKDISDAQLGERESIVNV